MITPEYPNQYHANAPERKVFAAVSRLKVVVLLLGTALGAAIAGLVTMIVSS